MWGHRVTEGEIYSTLFQTGEEGSNTYIQLTPAGDFEAVQNGKRIIFMQASSNEGRVALGNSGGITTAELHARYTLESETGTYDCIALISTSDADGVHIATLGGSSNITLYKEGNVFLKAGLTEIAISKDGLVDIGTPLNWSDVRIFGNLEVRGTINGA